MKKILEAKKAVGEAKMISFENFYARLDSKDGEKDIYKLAKWREKKTRDVSQVKCIKDDECRVLAKDDELLNEKHEENSNKEYMFYRRVQKSEVANALRRIN